MRKPKSYLLQTILSTALMFFRRTGFSSQSGMVHPRGRKMRNSRRFILGWLVLFSVADAGQHSLRVLTINAWTGLDYIGEWRMGEYETSERREIRFMLLLSQLRTLDPDIIFLQEANPVAQFSSRLADSLGFDEIHQVCNAGIKIGPLGPPRNLKEGIAILARPAFNLRSYDVWKLSGSMGIYGDALTIHADESIFSIVGRITVDGTPLFLVNVHLLAAIPIDSTLERAFESFRRSGRISERGYASAFDRWRANAVRQVDEARRLLNRLSNLPVDVPFILGGDFNASLGSPALNALLQDSTIIRAPEVFRESEGRTWNPHANTNTRFSEQETDARGDSLEPYDLLSSLHDRRPRTIDYIFLSNHFTREGYLRYFVALDSCAGGVCASDHFGVVADVDVAEAGMKAPRESSTITKADHSTIEPLPILSYDTDTGLGYGAKAFFLDQLGQNESFDCVLFNSTQGERWYRLVFSYPDFELRQGKTCPFAFDFLVDYDKWIRNSFFGVGNDSKFDDREYYTREPLEISITLSKGFTPSFVGQGGIRMKSVRNFNFEPTSTLAHLSPGSNAGTATYQSLFVNARFDSRNSFVNPSHGFVLQGEVEQTFHTSPGDFQFTRVGVVLQSYSLLFYPTTVLALRCATQGIIGNDLPVQVLSSVGGNATLRGSPQDRYLDKISSVANAEMRFPLYWRFGGVLGLDAGKVWSRIGDVDLARWATNPTAGLRLYMNTFVVRLDIGFGKETTGLYFNFGQIF